MEFSKEGMSLENINNLEQCTGKHRNVVHYQIVLTGSFIRKKIVNKLNYISFSLVYI